MVGCQLMLIDNASFSTELKGYFSPTHSALKHTKYRKLQFSFLNKHVHLDLDNSAGNNYLLFIDSVIYGSFINPK